MNDKHNNHENPDNHVNQDNFENQENHEYQENQDNQLKTSWKSNWKSNWKINFAVIWTGQAVSLLTSSVLQMALIWHLTFTTNSGLVLSLAFIAGFLPQAIFGTVAGTLVDRWNRKTVMIGADLFIAAVATVLAVVALFGPLPVWVVMVILFVRSIGTAFHQPALGAVTPLIVPENMLAKIAGYTQAVQSISFIAGPVVAAVLYPIWSMSALVALDVVGALFASLTVLLVAIPKVERAIGSQNAAGEAGVAGAGAGVGEVAAEAELVAGAEAGSVAGAGKAGADAGAGKAGFPGLWSEMKDGLCVVQEHRGLYQLLFIGAAYMFVFSPVAALFPLMSIQHFGGTTTEASIAEVAFAGGMLLGGLILGAWGGFQRRAYSIAGSIAVMGLSLVMSGLLPTNAFAWFAVACLFMGLSVPFYNGVLMALYQEKIAPEYLGRVFGLSGSIMAISMPLGLVVSGLFSDLIGVSRWFFWSGSLLVVLAGVCLALPAVRKV